MDRVDDEFTGAPSDGEEPAAGLEWITVEKLRACAGPVPRRYRLRAQIESIATRVTSNGGEYLETRLVDATGSLVWRVFDSSQQIGNVRDLGEGAFVEVDGQWLDAGKFGVEPRGVSLRKLTEEEKTELLAGDPETVRRQQEDWVHIAATVDGLTDPRLRGLCLRLLERHGARYRRAAAARENHHARRGGLVEHVAQMMRSADALCAVYPSLNRDLMMAGILFHDCGKMWENCHQEHGFAQPVSLLGEMLGHISLGMELINRLWREMMEETAAGEGAVGGLPPAEEARLHLLHLVASHHGQLEFGSPVLPKTPEAVALHHIDNIDAKLEMLRRGYASTRQVAPGVFDRFRPWPTRVVAPLPPFVADGGLNENGGAESGVSEEG
jgi:3'-5' exoribonuclease